ncbi:MAG: chromate transporter [Deltaproteobacteria bacterium]|nr:chromate transporter [Deltaproteobacteria bacterium]
MPTQSADSDRRESGAPALTLTRWLFECLRLGFVGVGGGLSILGQAGDRLVRNGWVSERDWVRTSALAQLIPGGAASNALADVGRKRFGVLAALGSVAIYVAPSVALMIALAGQWGAARNLETIAPLLAGLNAGVVGLVGSVSYRFGRQGIERAWQWGLAAGLVGLAVAGQHLPVLLGMGAAVGLIAGLLKARRTRARMVARRARKSSDTSPKASDTSAPKSSDTSQKSSDTFGPKLLLPFALKWPTLLAIPAATTAPLVLILFGVFLRVGLLAWGGGLAAVALIEHESVAAHGWVSQADLADAISLGQVTPGPMLVAAAFIGARAAGVVGGLAAAAGIFVGPALVVAFLGRVIEERQHLRVVKALFSGLVPAVLAAMAHATLRLGEGLTRPLQFVMAAVVFALVTSRKLGPTLSLVLAGLVGLALLRH